MPFLADAALEEPGGALSVPRGPSPLHEAADEDPRSQGDDEERR